MTHLKDERYVKPPYSYNITKINSKCFIGSVTEVLGAVSWAESREALIERLDDAVNAILSSN